jgi:diguanylate cyclase (GGDEF)-like protein
MILTSTVAGVQSILLISGDASVRSTMQDAFSHLDFSFAEDLVSGLVSVGKSNPHIVVVEIPQRKNDFEFALRALKKVKPDARIILLSNIFDEPSALNICQKGLAEDYLILPLIVKELTLLLNRKKFFEKPIIAKQLLPEKSADRFSDSWSGDSYQVVIREVSELIKSAELGLEELLDRICWSAVFLFKSKAAKIELGNYQACVGNPDSPFNLIVPLLQDGNEIGTLKLLTYEESTNLKLAPLLDEIIPSLVRLAGSRGKLQEMANTDALTGLANRRYLKETLDSMMQRAKEERFRITLVLFDFDDFKIYNDTYGHGAGDEILRESSILIKRCIRRQDLAARYGGDEFAVVLWDWQERRTPNSEHPRSATIIMQRFRKMLREHNFPRLGAHAKGSLTISGGLASFPWDASDVEELFERADKALLEAKRCGKDRIYLVGQGGEE